MKVRLIMDPVESPDSKRLAFSAMTHLYTMDLPHGQAAAFERAEMDVNFSRRGRRMENLLPM